MVFNFTSISLAFLKDSGYTWSFLSAADSLPGHRQ